MRSKVLLAVMTTGLLVGSAVAATSSAAAPTKTKPPVKLSGKVNNKGTKTVKGDEIEIELDDFYFKPTFIKGKPGTKVTLELENEGDTTHTFTLDDQDIDVELSSGKKDTVEVTIPKKGAAEFHCDFHSGSGMRGALFSKSGSTAKGSAKSKQSSPSTSSDDSGGGGYGY